MSEAQTAIGKVDKALDKINGYMSDYGAVSNKLGHALKYMEIYSENLKSSEVHSAL